MTSIAIRESRLPVLLEQPSEISKEGAFSSSKYLIVAVVIAGIAAAIFPFCFSAAVVLVGISSWYLWSSVIILLNDAAIGTSLQRPIHHLYALTMEVNCLVTSIGLFPSTFFSSYHGPRGDLKGRPILLVHGYLSFGSTWEYQRAMLIKEGLGPVYTMNLRSGKSIKAHAKDIQEKTQQIERETGRKDLVLGAHSMGGLACCYYTTHLADETETNVTDVITIGSPLAGTPLAYLGFGEDAAEMRSSSPFHESLRTKIQAHQKTRFFHIASEVDLVVPMASALLGENRARHLILKDIGHLGLVFSTRVGKQLCDWLKS